MTFVDRARQWHFSTSGLSTNRAAETATVYETGATTNDDTHRTHRETGDVDRAGRHSWYVEDT